MFTIEEVISLQNQKMALEHFKSKRNSKGSDGMLLADFPVYWEINGERICEEIRNQTYEPSIIDNYEIMNGKGKKRVISNMAIVDRFISRLLSQKLRCDIEGEFLSGSFAYQIDKGIVDAVTLARDYMEQGKIVLVEIDLKDYFDTIPLDEILNLIRKRVSDEAVLTLIKKYLYCKIKNGNRVKNKTIGLVQGNSISPILSNLYLHELDMYMESQKLCWMRFADNIYLFTNTKESAIELYNAMCNKITTELCLHINERKSGIYDALERKILGYEFYKKKGKIEVRKHIYKRTNLYSSWNTSKIQVINQEYHILQDGIINKKDYSLLFENAEEKHHIPVEAVEYLNIYSDVSITSSVLKTMTQKNIRCGFFDNYGCLEGYYVPRSHGKRADLLLKQCALYLDKDRRLDVARRMEIAGIHNMRSNIRYYNKKRPTSELQDVEKKLSAFIVQMNQSKSVEEMMLIEARARGLYYLAFNYILRQEEFIFTKRTKQPPRDCTNALISFGNTLLYNQFLQIIWKTALEPQIGIIHATNRRNYSLNLDLADIYKPIVVDRVIFSLINLKQIKAEEDFKQNEDGGVYLNKRGKRIFLEQFEHKLSDKITVQGKTFTYKQLLEMEVKNFLNFLKDKEVYKPYKYY